MPKEMLTRYVHHNPLVVESPGEGFPSYEDLVAENARLREALEPFAIFANEIEELAKGQNISLECWSTTVGFENLRAARAALKGEKA